ncbi:nucleotidyltransferase domain-containing protein [Salinispirillum sp. LH 10-3-1]|uniref:Nucleotidyltransferase domain-containing protein n=1 Tax=Salinispirillum sp. LH 10-3-1 TaxID=2952525 RepID=A0AB38YD01_9GAMM
MLKDSKAMQNPHLERLKSILTLPDTLDFLVLVGSRALDTAQQTSDWDIAFQFSPEAGTIHSNPMCYLAMVEALREDLAIALAVDDSSIDLIDAANSNLAMKAVIAEEGLVITGDEKLPWYHFLTRTWRELEDWYWEQEHAA